MGNFRRGIVVAAHPLAAKAGLKILKKGGNAIDAAVATALSLGVVTPAFCGIGGGGFALIWLQNQDRAIFVDYRERAPATATEETYKLTPEGKVVANENSVGHRAVAVPGSVAGQTLMIKEFGNLALREVVEPAANYARRGFPVTRAMADAWRLSASKLRSFPNSSAIYLRKNRPFRRGDKVRLTDLANSYRSISKNGPEEFYSGTIAKEICDEIASYNGLVSANDLQTFKPTIRQPFHGTYKGFDIVSAPPPSSGGAIIVQALNILENFHLKDFARRSPQPLHFIAEALFRAYSSIRPKVSDPDFSPVALGELVSKNLARNFASTISPDVASNEIRQSERSQPTSSTSHLSVVDSEGNVVALTESVECYFGSGVVVPRTGIILNDTMHDFDPKPGQPNSVGPRKIPMSSMSPTIIFRDGRPILAAGSAGSTRIVSSTFLTIINVLDFCMPIEEAVKAPRIHTNGNIIEVESSMPHETTQALRKMGHEVKIKQVSDVSPLLYFGGVHAALRQEKGDLVGGADPRREGAALGY